MPLPSVLDEINRLFDELIRRPWGTASRQLVPAEMREVEDGWIVKLPAPGMSAADLRIQVEGNWLMVTGYHRQSREHRHGKTGWSQRQQEVSLHRTIALPAGADPDHIDAKIEDSTLSIHIRRRQP
jgi:HSP20 family molecular chaperone IbpA